MEEKEKEEEIIILDNEITPPYNGSKKEAIIKRNRHLFNPALKGATEEYHKTRDKNLILGKNGVWKRDNYIIGTRTMDDWKYCEPVSALDLHNTAEIRKYLLAAEKFLTGKENKRSQEEGKNRVLKYVLCFGLGMSAVLWALYAGMINLSP